MAAEAEAAKAAAEAAAQEEAARYTAPRSGMCRHSCAGIHVQAALPVRYTPCEYGAPYLEGWVCIEHPPCKLHTVFTRRILQGGAGV